MAGAHAGNFVGGDADAHAAGAAEQAEFGAAIGDGLRRRLREIRIIIRRILRLRAEIHDGQAARLQVLLERFLEFKAAVVRAEREIRRPPRFALPVCRSERFCCSINFKSEAMPCSIWSRQST